MKRQPVGAVSHSRYKSVSESYFALLGVPEAVDIDQRVLDANYRAKSLERHPDRVRSADPQARRKAVQDTATLNDAYRVLRDDTARAIYLLKSNGIDIDAEGDARIALPANLLAEMMERREAMEAAKESAEPAAVAALAAVARQDRDAALASSRDALRKGEFVAAAQELVRARYLNRLIEAGS